MFAGRLELIWVDLVSFRPKHLARTQEVTEMKTRYSCPSVIGFLCCAVIYGMNYDMQTVVMTTNKSEWRRPCVKQKNKKW